MMSSGTYKLIGLSALLIGAIVVRVVTQTSEGEPSAIEQADILTMRACECEFQPCKDRLRSEIQAFKNTMQTRRLDQADQTYVEARFKLAMECVERPVGEK